MFKEISTERLMEIREALRAVEGKKSDGIHIHLDSDEVKKAEEQEESKLRREYLTEKLDLIRSLKKKVTET